MIRYLRGRDGSSAVFLTAVFSCMLAAVLAFVNAAQGAAFAGRLDAASVMAGRSVLAEYERSLKDEYGIFGFFDDGSVTADEKLEYYVSNSLPGSGRIISAKSDTSEFSLTDLDLFEAQIKKAAVMMGSNVDEVPEKLRSNLNGGPGGSYTGGPGGIGNAQTGRANASGRTLKSKKVISQLPSRDVPDPAFSISGLQNRIQAYGSAASVLDSGSEAFLRNLYIMNRFTNRFGTLKEGEHFFNSEVEYILCGKLSDEANRKAFLNQFILLRTALNIAYLFTDSQKMAVIHAAAQLMTPGPVAYATIVVMVTAWGLLEARNDATCWRTESAWRFSRARIRGPRESILR